MITTRPMRVRILDANTVHPSMTGRVGEVDTVTSRGSVYLRLPGFTHAVGPFHAGEVEELPEA